MHRIIMYGQRWTEFSCVAWYFQLPDVASGTSLVVRTCYLDGIHCGVISFANMILQLKQWRCYFYFTAKQVFLYDRKHQNINRRDLLLFYYYRYYIFICCHLLSNVSKYFQITLFGIYYIDTIPGLNFVPLVTNINK